MSREYPEWPVVGVGVVVLGAEGVLMIRRGKPPRQGQWSLPGGAQKLGETVFDTARRETREETGLAVRCVGVNASPSLRFDIDDPILQKKVTTLYIQEMAKRGCHGCTSFYLNAAQGPAEIDQTVEAAEETFTLITDGLRTNRINDLLECEQQTELFRRLVK